jgi:chromosomal replication initiator protein
MLPDEMWQTALGQLQMQMTRATFDTWVKQSRGLAYEDGTFIVGVASGYAKDWLENRLHNTIRRTLTSVLGRSVEVRYIVWADQLRARASAPALLERAGEPAAEDGSGGAPSGVVADEVLQDGMAPDDVAADDSAAADGYEGERWERLPLERAGEAGAGGDAGGEERAGGRAGGRGEAGSLSVTGAVGASEGLSARYTFDSFVVGPSNRLAHAAALAVAANPARAYNPLFLYGGVGLGKTHLLQAIGHVCRMRGLQVMYVSSETFTNDLIAAIKAKSTDRFRDRYRTIDVLLVDDIQFIAGKESTQEEFFHTFNTLHGQDRQLVISSDRPPKALVTLEDRLRSRFEWGLIADIQPPDLETRIAILQDKAEGLQAQVPYPVLERIARQVQSNIRELEGALNRVVVHARLGGLELTPEIVPVALADLMPRPGSVTMKDILASVAGYYQVTVADVIGRARNAELVQARHVAMYLARTEINASLPQIGHDMGGRDHTTVIHACEKVGDQLERNDQLRRDVLAIKERLFNRALAH